jgi:hypothetical protein
VTEECFNANPISCKLTYSAIPLYWRLLA